MFGICLHVAFVGSYAVVMLLGSQDIYISDASITIWPAQPPLQPRAVSPTRLYLNCPLQL